MSFNFKSNLAIALTAISGILLSTTSAHAVIIIETADASESQSSVGCELHEELYTVARQGEGEARLFRWKNTEFGPEYTPQKRCEIVSAKMDAAVQANGGSFVGLRLTNGPVNHRQVICVLKPSETDCNSNNVLFTLSRENERNAGHLIGQLLNIGDLGAGIINEDSGEQVVVDLGKWAKDHLHKSSQTSEKQNNGIKQTTPVQNGGGFH